jgi:hypothetical protein
MPDLTHRRSRDAREECWHVYYGDAHIGSIAIRTGNPESTDKWQWFCGFYPGSHPRECTTGTAASFDLARAAFESARRVFLSKRTEADFQAWQNHQTRMVNVLCLACFSTIGISQNLKFQLIEDRGQATICYAV